MHVIDGRLVSDRARRLRDAMIRGPQAGRSGERGVDDRMQDVGNSVSSGGRRASLLFQDAATALTDPITVKMSSRCDWSEL